MTTYEQLIRAYVASGRRYWHQLEETRKSALAEAFFAEHPNDMAEARFPGGAANIALLRELTNNPDHAAAQIKQRLVSYIGSGMTVRRLFEESREAYDEAEEAARREPDPDACDDELPALLRRQAI